MFFLLCSVLWSSRVYAQEHRGFFKRLADSVEYRVERTMSESDSKGVTPFWLTSNRYGLAGVRNSNWHVRAGVFGNVGKDSLQEYSFGYGVDLVAAHNYTSDFFVQQLYAELGYRNLLFTLGSKERPMNFKNSELSTGSQTFGVNSRVIPELRFEIPKYISVFGGKKLFSVRGHIAYGMLTDGNWEGTFANKGKLRYAKNVLYHSKSGFLKVGNEKIFPLTLEGGLEMACTFGGRYYRGDGFSANLYGGAMDFLDVLLGLSSDPGEHDYKNAKGNTVGSWLFNLTYNFPDWKARLYYDHYFEDHSGFFFSYGGYDGLYGLEVNLPKNNFVDDVVYEYVYTRYQSGALYHDPANLIGDKVFGQDNYYNHNLYAGWQHWGMAIGNPLFLSPLYNKDKLLFFKSNRFSAHHIGLSGNPSGALHYRLLYTFSKHYGTYYQPYDDIKCQRSFLAELNYSPQRLFRHRVKGWSMGVAFAFDHGRQTGNNTGFQISVKRKGFFSL